MIEAREMDIIWRKKYERIYYSYYSHDPADAWMHRSDEHELGTGEQHQSLDTQRYTLRQP
jgi:hypothetical protein